MKSINTLSDHAPKTEWLRDFFEKGNRFFEDSFLSASQLPYFKRFLRDAELIDSKNRIAPFFNPVSSLHWDSTTGLELIMINLVFNNRQFNWYVTNLDTCKSYSREVIVETLINSNTTRSTANTIYRAFKRLAGTPFGTVLRGFCCDGNDICRGIPTTPDPRVLLYGLFKFAEQRGSGEFTLTALCEDRRLTNIFGFFKEDAIPFLLGLSAQYPEFITASFTHDLEKITLAKNKASQDVLNLLIN